MKYIHKLGTKILIYPFNCRRLAIGILYAPQVLYADGKKVDFTPCATTFELDKREIGKNQQSRREINSE